MKWKIVFLKRSMKLTDLYQDWKRQKTQIIGIFTNTEEFTTNPAHVKRVRKHYEQLHTQVFTNVDKMELFFQKHSLPQST